MLVRIWRLHAWRLALVAVVAESVVLISAADGSADNGAGPTAVVANSSHDGSSDDASPRE